MVRIERKKTPQSTAGARDFGRRLPLRSHGTPGQARPQNGSIHGWGAGFRQEAPASLPRHAGAGTPTKRLNPRLGARDFGRRLPLRSRLLNASIFSCQRTKYKPFTPEGSAIGVMASITAVSPQHFQNDAERR